MLGFITGKIICVSEAEVKEARRCGLGASKLVLVRNGVSQPKEPVKHLGGKKGTKKAVLYVGRFDLQKGVDILFDLFKEDDPAFGTEHEFILIGDYINEEEKDPPQPVNIAVKYTGWVQREAVITHMLNCDILVMPSRWEGMPMTALEAMSVGRCLVVADIPPLREVVRDGWNGRIFSLKDGCAGLKEVLLSLNFDDIKEFGKNSLDWFSEQFSADSMCKSTSDIYISMVKHD